MVLPVEYFPDYEWHHQALQLFEGPLCSGNDLLVPGQADSNAGGHMQQALTRFTQLLFSLSYGISPTN